MDNLSRGLTTVEVAGVDRVVDDAVLVDLVVADHHLDLEELVLAHGGGQLLVRRGKHLDIFSVVIHLNRC